MRIDAAQAEVARCRELAGRNPAYEPELGLAIYNLCMQFKATSPITTSYLELLEEGIALHRRLLGRDRNSVPQLGLMLCWLGFAQYRLGWTDKARNLLEEGVGLIRRVEREQPDVFQTQLALALELAAFALGAAGDHAAALSAARESVAIWRHLVDRQPGRHDHYLASALHTLCFALQDAGRGEETEPVAAESVRITRRLRARSGRDGEHARLLANGLDLHAAALANRERWEDALPLAEEAVRRYQEARRSGDRSPSINYAQSLTNLSRILLHTDDRSAAKSYADSAYAECARRLRRTDDLAGLSKVASDLAEVMSDLGMTWSAKLLIKGVNARLDPRPRGLRRLVARLRRRPAGTAGHGAAG